MRNFFHLLRRTKINKRSLNNERDVEKIKQDVFKIKQDVKDICKIMRKTKNELEDANRIVSDLTDYIVVDDVDRTIDLVLPFSTEDVPCTRCDGSMGKNGRCRLDNVLKERMEPGLFGYVKDDMFDTRVDVIVLTCPSCGHVGWMSEKE